MPPGEEVFENLRLEQLRNSSVAADFHLSVIMVHSKICAYKIIEVASGIFLLSRISSVIVFINKILIMKATENEFEETLRESRVQRNVGLESSECPPFKMSHNPLLHTLTDASLVLSRSYLKNCHF